MTPGNLKSLAVLTAAMLLAVFLVPALAQTHSEEERVIAVEIPVQVVKGGKAVRGLTVENFEVLLKGAKQKIVSFQVVDLSVSVDVKAGESPTMPAAARRHFLFLFDLTFVDVGSVLRARESVLEILEEMHPTDLGAVATYSTTDGPKLVLGFTSDKNQIRAAINTLGAPNLIEGQVDPLKLTIVEPSSMVGEFGGVQASSLGAGAGAGKAGVDQAVADYLMGLQRGLDRTDRQQQRIQVSNLTQDFKLLAHMMGSVEGRKYVVYLSEGFDSEILMATADRGEIARMNQAAASGEYWKVDQNKRFGDTTEQAHLEEMLESFRRADCVIQAVNISEAAAEDVTRGRRSGNDALFAMADGTGGELYRNFNDLGEAMGQLFEKTSLSYVLVVQPDQMEPDGAYSKIKVKLKDAPRGSKAFHRPGVYAPRPFEQRAGMERQFQAADLILAGVERGSVPLSVLPVPFVAPDGGGRIVLLVEAGGSALGEGSPVGQLPAEVYAYALDGRGGIHDFAANIFTLDTNKVGALMQRTGLKFYGELDVPPGDYSIRVLVRNAITGKFSLRNVPVSVPEFSSGASVVLPPLFPEPMGKWVTVRAPEGQGGGGREFPFMAGSEPYLPGARPELAAKTAARLCLVSYNIGPGSLTVTSRVVDSAGETVSGPTLDSVRSDSGGPSGSSLLVADFRPGPLAPGEYTLEVTVENADTGARGSGSIPIVIVSR